MQGPASEHRPGPKARPLTVCNSTACTQELTRQYNNRGKYNVTHHSREVDEPRPQSCRRSRSWSAEGKAAKIRHMNIVGNTDLSAMRTSWSEFESNSTQLAESWYAKRDDQYSREKLSGDHGKAGVLLPGPRLRRTSTVESTQVSISPDKRKELFITANVQRRRDLYAQSDIKMTRRSHRGRNESRCCASFIVSKPGDTYLARASLEQRGRRR